MKPQEGFIGGMVKAFGLCSLEGNRDRLPRSKGWGVKERGTRRWLGEGDHWTGERRLGRFRGEVKGRESGERQKYTFQ